MILVRMGNLQILFPFVLLILCSSSAEVDQKKSKLQEQMGLDDAKDLQTDASKRSLDILSYGKQGYPSSGGYDHNNNYYPVGGYYPNTYYNQRYPQNGWYPSGTGYQNSGHGYPSNYYPDSFYPNKLNPFNWLSKIPNIYSTSPTYYPGSNCIGANCYNTNSRYPSYSTSGYPTNGYSTSGYPNNGYSTSGYPTSGYPDSTYGYSTAYPSRGNGGYGGYYGNGGLNTYNGYDGYYNAGNRPGNLGFGYHQARFLPGGTPSSFPSVDSGPLPAITTPHSVSKDAK